MESVYTEADADGLVSCKHHPAVARFRPDHGCPEPHTFADKREVGEGEKMVIEAERRGLPDAMAVEDRFWSAWAYMQKRAEMCAKRADDLYETGIVEDIDRAIKLEAAAAKWADSSTKAGKIASNPVLQRTRMAELEHRARIMKSKAAGVH